jgi:hypothetical protein
MFTEHEKQLLKEVIEPRFGKGKATKSYLRQEAVLKNNQSTLDFDFDGKRNSKPSERLLAQQDIFFATALGLFLLREEDGKEGSGVLLTHVDSSVFAAATGFTPAHLEAVYNGLIKAQMGNQIIFEALATKNFRHVPTHYVERDGTIVLNPTIIINGKEKNKFTLNIPSFAGIQIASVTENISNKVVLMAEGFLVTGLGL